MPERHLSHSQLKRLLDGDLSENEMRTARRHLGACDDCEREISGVLAELPLAPPATREAPAPRIERRRAATGDGGLDRLRLGLEEERLRAGAAYQDLTEDEILAPGRTLAESPDLCTWGAFERALEEGRSLLASSPQRARARVLLALQVAERLDPGRYGDRILETARFRGWAHLGNVRRVVGDLEGAEKAFRRAEFHFWASDLDPLDEAMLLQFRAVLRRDQRRFDEAVELVDDARALCREVRETHREGRALLARAIIDLYRGQPEEAALGFAQSITLLDPVQEPKLPLFCLINQVLCLTEADRPQEAAALLPEAKRLATGLAGDPISQLRLRWMEARVAWGLERLGEAEPAFRSLQEEFLQADLPYDAALVSLDLAALLAGAGRTRETRELVEEMIPFFQSRQIHREALAALVVLQQAAATERITLARVREAVHSVRIAALDPAARSRS